MELALTAALALALGFLLGLGVGAARAYRMAATRRAAAGASGALARIWPETMPARSAADIMAGRIRVVLGAYSYDLPVLPRRQSREWLASLDSRFATLAAALDEADTPLILSLLATETDALYDLLLEYDRAHQLPPRAAIDDFATDAEILRAVLEVWAALHPLAATLVAASEETPTGGTSPVASSTSPAPTAGAPTTLTPLPTSSSSPTSTPAKRFSPRATKPSSTAGSRP